ncbi:MAG: c-type cytochrome biogenesis protein CcsB [Chloroflexi bacterium]|nr:c-type cytochrome biogenesis protein CcsB [Chloroflexota bacterium]
MAKMSLYFFFAGIITLGLGSAFYFWHVFSKRWGLRRYATMMLVMSFVVLTLSLVFRSIKAGHGPFSNQYEFAVTFGWGTMAAYFYLERQYRPRTTGVFILPIALAVLLYALLFTKSAIPDLVPALQNAPLLTAHVAVAVIAYGAAAVSFASAAMFLVQRLRRISWMPTPQALEDMSYRAVTLSFPFMVLTLVLGALWANTAWGSYWSWDPKETASLVTTLIYGGYIHARGVAGWRGTRSALLLILGFVAVLFTYFGNYFLGGLHSYS